MKFYDLKSLVAAHKEPIQMRAASPSFQVAPARTDPYIEPSFDKVEFHVERPPVILVSAIGATGKTALAQVLSNSTGLPLLDLAKHKPVGDNTLTGVLTSAFGFQELGPVFEGIARGTFGMIIDGVDEGRSKTNEKAFEAFLDDIVRLCATSSDTSFVLLGRTQILEECWLYLTTKGINAALLNIAPFDLDSARHYIDEFTCGAKSTQAEQYRQARDGILAKIASAFASTAADTETNFLSFIGYPPVLDAIVTFLKTERNYHRIQEELEGPASDAMETGLLLRIASYIVQREKEQKVIPNIAFPLLAEFPKSEREAVLPRVFESEEQYMRLVAHCLEVPLDLSVIPEPVVNSKYEEQVSSFLPEHPFIEGRRFRNAVFEAIALATLIASEDELAIQLAINYLDSTRMNYYLIYILDLVAAHKKVPIGCLRALLGCAMEFNSRSAAVELHVNSLQDFSAGPDHRAQAIEILIEIIMGAEGDRRKTIIFTSDLSSAGSIQVGPRLSSAYILVPCDIELSGAQELELIAPVFISGRKITIRSKTLVLRYQPQAPSDLRYVMLEADSLESSVGEILPNGTELVVGVADRKGLGYPIVRFAENKVDFSVDPLLNEKYLKLRRILVHFRSHSRGSLAKFKRKVDNERVAGNEIGQAVLNRLLADQILTEEGSFYFLQRANVDRHLGISWIDLQKGRTSEKLLQYLRSING